MTTRELHKPKPVKFIDINKLPRAAFENDYDKFDLDFLVKKDGKIMNGEFDVTDVPDKLYGCPTGNEEINLKDYLVYRPVPKELIQWRDLPAYHPDSLDMENWYRDLIEYCKHGVWVDGEYWNPYMVYWLNVFVFPVPKYDEDGNLVPDFDPGHPFYCNIDRYILDIAWKARLTKQDVSLMGGRGIGKSYLWGSIMDREYRLFPNSWTVVSSTNDETTSEAWNKVEECLTAIEKLHRALKHKRITDSLTMKYSGEVVELPDGTTEDRGYLAKMEKITYGKNAGKTRGKRPTIQLIEEFAAFPPTGQKGDLKSCMRESRGSWYVMGGMKKCTVLYSGTGGTVENDQAEGIFMDPIASECIPTWDWEEAGDKGCGIFIPTHIKRSGTWEDSGCPDVALGRMETEEERAKKKSDPIAYMGLLQEFPMTIKEVFLRTGVNIFDQDKIATQRTTIDFGKDNIPKPGRGFLKWKQAENGKIIGVEWDPAPTTGDIEILEHPHWLQDITDLPDDEKQPMKDLYVSGCDSIDQGNIDSSYATDNKKGSELCMMVKKRVVDKGYFKYTSNIYVAKYNKRSDDVRDDWGNALKLAIYYNSQVNIEYTKIGIVGYFRDMGFYHLLKKRPSIALQGGDPKKSSNLIGTQVSSYLIDHMDGKIKSYIDDSYDKIWFPDLLAQLQDYDRDNRTKYDMVIAMGLCELSDEDLMGKVAKPPVRETQQLQSFGYWTEKLPDGRRIKRYGVIPEKKGQGGNEMEQFLEAEKFKKHGGVRWIDMTDPDDPKPMY